MEENFQLTSEHSRWAKRANQKYGKPAQFWKNSIRQQGGKCALTNAQLLFDAESGTPQKGGNGCHPLYAAIDRINPGRTDFGFQIICYDINDLKGHLPPPLFRGLARSKEWKLFIDEWKRLAESSGDRQSFKELIRSGAPNPDQDTSNQHFIMDYNEPVKLKFADKVKVILLFFAFIGVPITIVLYILFGTFLFGGVATSEDCPPGQHEENRYGRYGDSECVLDK